MTTPQLIFGLLWTLAAVTAGTSVPGKLVQKSFQRAKLECHQYLDNSDGPCQSRCEAIVLHSWDDCSGLQYIPYSRHFRPDLHDKDYMNSTLRCLEDGLTNVSSEAVCCKASVNWRCYRNHWGNLIGTPQLVPLSKLQISSSIKQCAEMLQISKSVLKYYARNYFDVSDRSRCLLRCVLIRQGLYSDASGPDLDRMYVQCGGYNTDEETFKRNASECIDRLRGKCYDKCTLATRIVKDCFPMDAGILDQLFPPSDIGRIARIIEQIMDFVLFGDLLSGIGALGLAIIFATGDVPALRAVLAGLGLSFADIDQFIFLLLGLLEIGDDL